MLEVLKFVRGAVAEKDLIPILTHFRIYKGRIQGSNGRIAIDAPCPELKGLDITVPADKFLRAVDTCDGEPKLAVKDGKLIVKRGKFTARLPIGNNDEFYLHEPDQGQHIGMDIEFIKDILPFVGTDASRPWACGMLLDGNYAYATNNVILVRHKVVNFIKKRINIPRDTLSELYRIGLDYSIKLVVTENHITVKYTDGSWLRSNLFSTEWPDLSKMFKKCTTPVPDKLKDAVSAIMPFFPDPKLPVIRFGDDGVSTTEGDVSAVMSIGKLSEAYFRAEPLNMVLNIATHFNWDPYPAPCPFKTKNLDGVIVGVRQ